MQIETNRNTALTLACFQGRHEVVSLLVDRKANIEHRAKVSICRQEFLRKKLISEISNHIDNITVKSLAFAVFGEEEIFKKLKQFVETTPYLEDDM